ncbi:hypothetical protein EJ04DRAFT_516402 [Polyplosphaeria fusca]|uniref:Uncharacterized protein n=1 Tax=Polyplosphaeria fusca TaxID=682080 RepID=A0A9P4UUB8_9PLEO|nr:hypothetical protein EJ04DRAFT_516402 [Polyplosphaeria fusca]
MSQPTTSPSSPQLTSPTSPSAPSPSAPTTSASSSSKPNNQPTKVYPSSQNSTKGTYVNIVLL